MGMKILCPYCNKQFSTHYSLGTHLSKSHKNTKEGKYFSDLRKDKNNINKKGINYPIKKIKSNLIYRQY